MKSTWAAACLLVITSCSWLPLVSADETDKAEKPTVDPMFGKDAGDIRDDNGLKIKLVWCPPGSFVMGDFQDEDVMRDKDGNPKPDVIQPVRAFLTRGFWLGSCEVTQSDWMQVMDSSPWKGKAKVKEGPDFPASFISFDEATEFCRRLTEKERHAGRLSDHWEYSLPTEAQWERACRAGSESRYCFGSEEKLLDEYAWSFQNSIVTNEVYGHRVGQKRPNTWGLYDMHGNLWEWCRDVYAYELPGGRDPEVLEKDPTRKRGNGPNRVIRGGCYHEPVPRCRSGFRQPGEPQFQGPHLGFRIALSAIKSAN